MASIRLVGPNRLIFYLGWTGFYRFLASTRLFGDFLDWTLLDEEIFCQHWAFRHNLGIDLAGYLDCYCTFIFLCDGFCVHYYVSPTNNFLRVLRDTLFFLFFFFSFSPADLPLPGYWFWFEFSLYRASLFF